MTKQEFAELPYKKWNEDVGRFDALVIITGKSRDLHDSGYRNMTYALCKDNYPICLAGGGSDILHLNGIGGYGGYKTNIDEVLRTRLVPIVDWSIDCLPKSGYLRLWCSYYLTNETDFSSFDVIAQVKR